MAKSSKAKSKRYTDSVELFKVDTETSEYGTETSTEASIGTFSANVDVMTGSRFELYKQYGYTAPVTIRMYAVDAPFDFIKWKGKKIQTKSINQDKSNIDKIVIYGDIINDTPCK